jgi:hypothetical protein
MFYENNFKKNLIFNFLVKKQFLYLCKYTNLFPILKISLDPHFLSYAHNFFCEVLEDP